MASNRLPNWIFAFAFFPLGLGGFVLGSADIVQGYRSQHWTQVQGVILSARLSPGLFGPDQPDIRYRYELNGQPYVSTRLWPGSSLSDMPVLTHARSQRLIDQFPANAMVPVFVNPRNPLQAVIIPGPAKAWRWMGVFTFFLLLGFGGGVVRYVLRIV